MKILFLSPRLPHELVASGHIIVYQRMQRLVRRGHQVDLACFCEPEDLPFIEQVKSFTGRLQTLPMPPLVTTFHKAWRWMWTSSPPYFCDFYSPEMMKLVGDMVHEGQYDAVIAEFSAMGQYLYRNPWLPAVRKIISCHYSITTAYQTMARVLKYSARGVRSRIALNALVNYEAKMYRSADRVLALTAQERYGLLKYAPDLRITVIPAGVDVQHFCPNSSIPKENLVLFTGHYSLEANRDAARWFAQSVWPQIRARFPDYRFAIVGPGAAPDVRELAQRDPTILLTGIVDDIRAYLCKAKVFVCPVRLGSGLRVKILDAMACGLPVVTTMLGAEGIPLETGRNCFIADRPKMMADYINLLLSDDYLRNNMSRNARSLMVERFDWEHGIDSLEKVLLEITPKR